MTGKPRTFDDVSSERCKDIAAAASDFFDDLNRLLDQMAAERNKIVAQNIARSDPRFLAFEDEHASVLAVVNATAEAAKMAWDRLNSRPLSPAP